MAIEVKIPQISEGVDTATVTEVLVSEGDTIEEEQSVIAVETDKASVEVPSSHGGTVKSIKVKEGDEVNVGDVIITLEESSDKEEVDEDKDTKEESEESSDKKEKKEDKEEEENDKVEEEKEEDTKEEKKEKEKKSDSSSKENKEEEKDSEKEDENKENEEEEDVADKEEEEEKEKQKADDKDKNEEPEQDKKEQKKDSEDAQESGIVSASPGVRRVSRELGVDIQKIKGSGEGGRITEEDVRKYAKNGKSKSKNKATSALPDFSKWGDVDRKPLSNIRKVTAQGTTNSWQTIPHVFQFDEADITNIEEYMEKSSKEVEAAGGKLTITSILLKIAANALIKFPKFNSSIDMENEDMITKQYINIGIAVDTEKGLLLPVIRDVDKKNITELAVEITEIAEKARNQKLKPDEMKGGNFSISNLGGIGGTNFTPIIYHPQVAILGVSRSKKKPVYINDTFEPRDILPLSLAYDHRLIDGAEGAEFLDWIKQALEDPYKALLG